MAVYDISGNVIANTGSGGSSIPDVVKTELRRNAWLHLIASDTSAGTVQGACTDGTYIYYVSTGTNKIKKYNLATGELTEVSYTSGLYGHANDLTYNPNTNRIYLTVMDDGAHIAIINPSTLAQESSFVLYGEGGVPIPNHGIAYDRLNNRYIVANATVIEGTYGQRYSLFDANFNFVRTIVMPQPETYTIQGIETDGVCIYRALWNSGHANYIAVYDYEGNYLGTVTIQNTSELEAVMYDWNGNWYLNINTSAGGDLYMVGLFTTTPMESIEKLIQ